MIDSLVCPPPPTDPPVMSEEMITGLIVPAPGWSKYHPTMPKFQFPIPDSQKPSGQCIERILPRVTSKLLCANSAVFKHLSWKTEGGGGVRIKWGSNHRQHSSAPLVQQKHTNHGYGCSSVSVSVCTAWGPVLRALTLRCVVPVFLPLFILYP